MTRNEFKKLLVRLNPNNAVVVEDGSWPSTNLPMIAGFTAAHCFTHWVDLCTPQNERDMDLLRRQMLALEKTGCFDFEGE